MSNTNEVTNTPEGKDDFLKAILKFIKSLFSGKGSGKGNKPHQTISNGLNAAQEAMGRQKFDNGIAKELALDHAVTLNLTKDFIENNRDELSSLIEKNKLSEVKHMIKTDLMPDIEIYFESKELSDDVMSNPMRRVKGHRHEIIDNVNAVFSAEFDGIDDVLSQVSDNADKYLSKPTLSHQESLDKSKRFEQSKEISQETVREMTADAPKIPDA